MTRALLTVLLAAQWSVAGAGEPAAAAQTLWECLDDPRYLELPIAELTVNCPGLAGAITATGWSESLPDGWEDRSTGVMLADLAALVYDYDGFGMQGGGPDMTALDGILTGLEDEDQLEQAVSFWTRFLDWLKESFERLFPGLWDKVTAWLDGLTISDPVVDGVGMVGMALIAIVAAAMLAALAVYAWRRFSASRGTTSRERSTTVGTAPLPSLSLAQIDAAPLTERPRLLLRYLLQELERRQQLPGSARLTHRELTGAAPFDHGDQVSAFARIVMLAERATYGTWRENGDEFSSAYADGRALLHSLGADTP